MTEVYNHTSSNVFFEPDGDKRKRKDKYREEFLPLLDEKDELTEKGKTDLTYFKNSFFARRYGNRLKDRESKENKGTFFTAFQSADGKRKQGQKNFNYSVVICSILSFFLSSVICFLLVPLIHKRGKTLGRMARKTDRINVNGFRTLSRGKRCYSFILNRLFALPYLIFLPCFYIPFTQLFSFLTLSVSLSGLVLDLVSLVFLLINSLNRSFSDWLSSSVLISSADYEQLPRSKQ